MVCINVLAMWSKTASAAARTHNISQTSTAVKESDLDEGSLSLHLGSLSQGPSLELQGSAEVAGAVRRAKRPKQPLLLLSLKRLVPSDHRDLDGTVSRQEKNYDVIIEPGAGAGLRVLPGKDTSPWVEPGGPFQWSESLRSTGRGTGSSSARSQKTRRAPLELVAHIPMTSRTPGAASSTAKQRPAQLPGLGPSGAATARAGGKFGGAAFSPGLSGLSTRPGTSSTRPGTSAAGDGCSSQLSSRGRTTPGTGVVTAQKEVPEVLEPSQERAAEEPHGQLLEPTAGPNRLPPFRRGISHESDGANEKTGKKKVARLRKDTRTEEVFEMTTNGMKAQPNAVNQRIKTQIRDLGSVMVKTMTQTYHRDVWDACEILHPDKEKERDRAAREAAKAQAAERAAEKIRGLKLIRDDRDANDPKETGPDADRQMIRAFTETQESLRQISEEKALAWLARQTNWSVLDVEEVHDIFIRYATYGTLVVGGPDFLKLIQEIYNGSTEEEVKLLTQQITGLRRRSVGWRNQNRKSVDADRSEVRFSEFYLALVKWLTVQHSWMQTARMNAKKEGKTVPNEMLRRCSLARFHDEEEGDEDENIDDIKENRGSIGSAGTMAEIRMIKQEVKDEMNPEKAGGIGKLVMQAQDHDEARPKKKFFQANTMARTTGFAKASSRSSSGSLASLGGSSSSDEDSDRESTFDANEGPPPTQAKRLSGLAARKLSIPGQERRPSKKFDNEPDELRRLSLMSMQLEGRGGGIEIEEIDLDSFLGGSGGKNVATDSLAW